MNDSDKNSMIEQLRQEEQRLAEEARTDSFQVPPGTPRFGAFAEDDPETHRRYAEQPEEESPDS
ncbi:MAG: hypothetical protein M1269_09400 [Chloroflexi bacterium]|nr:hypothetical protein [Chloroflexota bacterium]